MTAIEHCLQELADNLHVRGRTRRRFLRECGDHLRDAAIGHGEEAASRAFGDPAVIAAQFDAEIALRRGFHSTIAAMLGVAAIAWSTLALIHSATPGATGPAPVAAAFFISAQISAVATALAAVEAFALRRSAGAVTGSDLSLLGRRNACALIASVLTMLAAGVALPGRGSAPVLLTGPLIVCLASLALVRAGSLTRRISDRRKPAYRSPVEDLAAVTGLPLPARTPMRLLAVVTAVAAVGATVRDHLEHATAAQAAVTGSIEAVAVVAGFALLGGTLGIRRTAHKP